MACLPTGNHYGSIATEGGERGAMKRYPNKIEIGELIKRLRERAGIDKAQLSGLSGVSASFIGRLEAGQQKNPSPETLRRLSVALNVTHQELLIAAGHIEAENTPVAEADRLVSIYTRLPSRKRKELERFASYLASNASDVNFKFADDAALSLIDLWAAAD